jgi:EF-P beta-lysylation protein EpmB
MREAVRDPAELCRLVGLPELVPQADAGHRDFPVFVPRPFLQRIRPGDPCDPLLLQVLPVSEEGESSAADRIDPVGDLDSEVLPGLLHKYTGRVLLVTTGACAIHCRYCFRRHFPYAGRPRGIEAWEPALEHIAGDASINEVILSGGDPLTIVDQQLAKLAERLAAIPHVRRLRVHTRLPIMIPRRVNDELLAWLTGTRLTPVMVIHANHAQELDNQVAEALQKLSQAGVLLLNQTVLLGGVNDSVAALAELSERLVELRVTPYYLHQLDRVVGAAHFEVPLAEGQQLIAELRRRLPGYAVPRYVQELAGEAHKRVLA